MDIDPGFQHPGADVSDEEHVKLLSNSIESIYSGSSGSGTRSLVSSDDVYQGNVISNRAYPRKALEAINTQNWQYSSGSMDTLRDMINADVVEQSHLDAVGDTMWAWKACGIHFGSRNPRTRQDSLQALRDITPYLTSIVRRTSSPGKYFKQFL